MAIYRNISMSFWTDSKVDDDFTPEDKYFYLYLLTNPHTNICGCFEISMKQMCRESGYNEDTVRRLLDRMEHQHGVLRYSPATKEILIVNWHKYNWPCTNGGLSAVYTVAKSVKDKSFRDYLALMLNNHSYYVDVIPYEEPEKRNERLSKEYDHWRMAVFKRDRFCCKNCGTTQKPLNAHHKQPWAKYPDLRYDINNGITLCEDCHKKIHRRKGK